MGYFGVMVDDTAEVREYCSMVDAQLRHEEEVSSIIDFPKLFITGYCKRLVLKDDKGKKSIRIIRMNLLFPPYHVLIGIALLVSAWLWGWIIMGVIGAVFLLLGLLWSSYVHYLLFNMGLRKATGTSAKWLSRQELCKELGGE